MEVVLSEGLADFVLKASYDDISEEARQALKMRILDSIGCAIGALDAGPVMLILEQLKDFGGNPVCTLIGASHVRNAPDRAAFYNSALIRYLDFNDSFLAKNETCHPSDNLGALLAACEYSGSNGRELLTALAIAYQVQCRLSEAAPVRAKGFDHTTQGSYALAAGISKALRLSREKTINAIAICGAAFNALRVTRTGALSNWKGLAYPNTAFCCVHGAFLAMRGITGPREVFEGNKGFMDSIAGRFEIDWSKEGLEAVRKTAVKKYNAEVHSQSAIEGVLELRKEHGFSAGEIERVELDIFDVAYNIIGGGEEGDKKKVRTKEEADHSLHYMAAAALIDGELTPGQYSPERIIKSDVQGLLTKITVRPDKALSRLFPENHPCDITIVLKDGRRFSKKKMEYEGFITMPMRWEGIERKFSRLAGHIDSGVLRNIIDTVKSLEKAKVSALMGILSGLRAQK